MLCCGQSNRKKDTKKGHKKDYPAEDLSVPKNEIPTLAIENKVVLVLEINDEYSKTYPHKRFELIHPEQIGHRFKNPLTCLIHSTTIKVLLPEKSNTDLG
jgi:hypothetical protein